jgi:hypothetical protein
MGATKVLSLSLLITQKAVLTQKHSMILTGLTGIIIVEIYAAVMQFEFQNSTNKLGKGFAILGIYLFVVAYCQSSHTYQRWLISLEYIYNICLADQTCIDGMLNSTTWLYGAEVLPIALRSKVMGLAAASHFIVNVASECSNISCLSLTSFNYLL